MFLQIGVALGITLTGATGTPKFGQKLEKCKAQEQMDAPGFRIGRIRRTVEKGVPILLLQISVEPEHFNKADMMALARRLKGDFCKEKQLNVAICDDVRAAMDTHLIFDLLRNEPNAGLRGGYDLDRVNGKESISFSTKRGRPLDEVKINLANE